ncbi:MAG: hypothetical protein LBV49_05270, partial [Azonexus sp.]|nr:hypothetical protein [Azonexus sp.]
HTQPHARLAGEGAKMPSRQHMREHLKRNCFNEPISASLDALDAHHLGAGFAPVAFGILRQITCRERGCADKRSYEGGRDDWMLW